MTPEQLRPQHDLAGDQSAEDHDVIQDTTAGPPWVDRASPRAGQGPPGPPQTARAGRSPPTPGAALDANVARPRLCLPADGAGAAVRSHAGDLGCDRAADLTLWGAMALMAERIFLITAIVFGIVVPIAVMVALVYMK